MLYYIIKPHYFLKYIIFENKATHQDNEQRFHI